MRTGTNYGLVGYICLGDIGQHSYDDRVSDRIASSRNGQPATMVAKSRG